jgi:Outer membrane protein beta-barrel domain
MKKVILVMLAAASSVIASAQIRFGVKAGVNIANVTYSGSSAPSSLQSITDFNGGLFASIPLFSSCSLQPEVVYSGQGTSANVSSVTAKLNYDYLNVPVLFKYQHSTGLFAETGPQVGFVLSAKEKADGQTTDVKSNSQSTDFSWAFGIGYQIKVINLGIDARYNLGLTDVNKDNSNGTVKNSVFQFGLFYTFPKF